MKAWPADDYLYSYMCKHLLNAEAKWSTGKLNPDPNGSEENQMKCPFKNSLARTLTIYRLAQ